MTMNLYKNGYLLHCILGYAILETFIDLGLMTGILMTIFFAIGKEIYDLCLKKKAEITDILSTLAGGILGLGVEWVKQGLLLDWLTPMM